MPQRRTAKKELRKAAKRWGRNAKVKRQLASTLKNFKKSIPDKDTENLRKALNQVYKILDKAASKNIIHPNKAARKKSRMASLIPASRPKSSPKKTTKKEKTSS